MGFDVGAHPIPGILESIRMGAPRFRFQRPATGVPLLQKPTVRQNVSAAVGTLEKKKEASTIHPHHCSKVLFQNEDSHSKKNF